MVALFQQHFPAVRSPFAAVSPPLLQERPARESVTMDHLVPFLGLAALVPGTRGKVAPFPLTHHLVPGSISASKFSDIYRSFYGIHLLFSVANMSGEMSCVHNWDLLSDRPN